MDDETTLDAPHAAASVDADPDLTRELRTLLAVAQAVAATVELEPLLELILDQLKVVTDYSGAGIFLLRAAALELIAGRGATPADREYDAIGLRLSLARGGALWATIDRREAAIIADVEGEEALAQAYRAWLDTHLDRPAFQHIRALMLVPLIAKDHLIGVFIFAQRVPGHYTAHHARLAAAIASQAALAIENARLYEAARADAQRATALAQIAANLTVDQSIEAALSTVAGHVVQATAAVACAVLLLDGAAPQARFAGTAGFPDGLMPRVLALPNDQLDVVVRDRALRQHEPQIIRHFRDDVQHAPQLAPLREFLDRTPWGTLVLLPLVFHGRALGLLNAYYAADSDPGEEELTVLRPIADQAAVAVENARLFLAAADKAVVEERTRLAHDLHDSVTQTVFSLGLLARAAQAQNEQGSQRLGHTLDRVASLAQDALVELRPAELADEGLPRALARLAEVVSARTSMTVTVQAAEPVRLAADTELTIFRIVQEALGNAVKHAQATACTVTLTMTRSAAGGQLRVTVQDNGVGFDPSAPVVPSADGTRGGQGMRSMRERAAIAGLALQVASAPGRGATITIEAPVATATKSG
jgi:signal transduction histidine kinase